MKTVPIFNWQFQMLPHHDSSTGTRVLRTVNSMQKRKLGNSKLEVSVLELTADDLREIDSATQIAVHGARYPEHLARLTGR